MYKKDWLEIMGDMLDNLQEWRDYEADIAKSDPWAK